MLKKTKKVQSLTPAQMAKIGMLSAITVILGVTNTGFIQLPLIKATIMHIPVIIGAIVEGPVAGMLIGLIFGLFSMLQNITAPTSVFSPALINPLVSVLPRVLIGLVAYFIYKLTAKRTGEVIGIAAGTALGSITNTVGVLGMIYLTFIKQYAAVKNVTLNKAISLLYGIAYTNGLAEAIVAVIIVVPVVLAVKRYQKSRLR